MQQPAGVCIYRRFIDVACVQALDKHLHRKHFSDFCGVAFSLGLVCPRAISGFRTENSKQLWRWNAK
jgi:hypothetical protein